MKHPCSETRCLSRRAILLGGGMVVSRAVLGEVFPGRVAAQDARQPVLWSRYPRKKIARLAALRAEEPLFFSYPRPAPHTDCVLVRTPRRAGGGAGGEQNIVAFNLRCTHMGGDLSEGLREDRTMLVCEEHLTSYDLTRHGMVVAGHATQSLPQIVLEVQQGDIFAVGIVGLLFGYHQNPV